MGEEWLVRRVLKGIKKGRISGRGRRGEERKEGREC